MLPWHQSEFFSRRQGDSFERDYFLFTPSILERSGKHALAGVAPVAHPRHRRLCLLGFSE